MGRGITALGIALFLSWPSIPALAGDYRWIQYGPDGAEIRLITEGGTCPEAAIDGKAVAMTTRAAPDAAFPIRVCALAVPAGSRSIALGGESLPPPPAEPRRILVIGDTGCRIEGEKSQACNDPAAWPFGRIADLAAAMKPDLIVHVGDYHYRESACPENEQGCAGSPFGDNWAAWQADFFAPAERLLKVAPWVVVRGNHEICQRGGQGWMHMLDPRPYDSAQGCRGEAEPYYLRIGNLSLAVFDVSSAAEGKLDKAEEAAFAPRFQALAGAPADTWLLLHRPLLGIAKVENGKVIGGNTTLIAAAKGRLGENVSLTLSGHIHTFEALNYAGGLPPLMVVGESGVRLDEGLPEDMTGLSVEGMSVASGLARPGVFGFVMLEKSAQGWSATDFDASGKAVLTCRIAGRAISCP